MDASFWPRLGAGLLGIGRLDPAAAAQTALVDPLQAHDVRIKGVGRALNEEYIYNKDGVMETPASWTAACQWLPTCR